MIIHRHHLSAKDILLLAAIYIVAPLLLMWIGYTMYNSTVRPLPSGRHFYQLEEFSDSQGVNSPDAKPAQYSYQMPPLTLSINSGHDSGTMKIDFSLEVGRDELSRLKSYEPRIIEGITLFLYGDSDRKMRDPGTMNTILADLKHEIVKSALPLTITDVFVRKFVFE